MGTGNLFIGLLIVSFGLAVVVICGKKMDMETPEMNDELVQLIRGKSAYLTFEVTLPAICMLFLAVAFLPPQIPATYTVGFFFVFYQVFYLVSWIYYHKKYT